ncbi:unnamed protein product [Adineta steineri]|uniref:Uncharacterized protein n=1 Tax=Adineta steineri TaxID=433720 RepID=A0A818ITX7_9BILA|nr:unnamed protein product [Adineta steineri]CAF3529977.1 unnamed protein product [Adineta steineri]
MSSTDTNVKDNTDVDNNSQTRKANTSPAASTASQSSSPAGSTLFVIDDNSSSESPTPPIRIPTPPKPMTSTIPQTSHIPVPTTSLASTHDIVNGTAAQQRRRNSSIAKLLGGHPLNNQHIEEIHQQILDDLSAQNTTNNNDNGTDIGIQRSRSSITRTLLMNSERINSIPKLHKKPQAIPTPSIARDFEYLIRSEYDKPDTEQSSSILQRNNSSPKIIQNPNARSPTHSKLKRKRPILKPPLPPTSNIPPFSLHEPFELQSSSSATNPTSSLHHSHSQNDIIHSDSSKRIRHSNSQSFSLPVNASTINQSSSSSYPCSKLNMNSTLYNQYNIHRDLISSSNTCSSSCNCSQYSHSTKLTLPSPITHVSSSPAIIPQNNNNNNNINLTATRKAKSMFARTDIHDLPRQRSYSSTFNQSDSSLSSPNEPNVPLKKRLLHAYNHEQRPPTPL